MNTHNLQQLMEIAPSPVTARHAEYSMIYSADDEDSKPSDFLLDISLNAIAEARKISLNSISSRITTGPNYPEIWPGEHYKLLAALAKVLQPSHVLEIGTATGMSALSLLNNLPEAAQIYSFDLIEWKKVPNTVLRDSDFESKRLTQCISDLRDMNQVNIYKDFISKCSLIFIDAEKDGFGEFAFLRNLQSIKFEKAPIVVFDDIKLWNMLKFWREIKFPKIDLTSFGHWSGTGLIELKPS